ncbi:citrate lyase holo-[acyl-carrier protein] synthase [Lysinibacillus macroides]|uniref:citrate lyase holo-[acyl-carrier protein] synthase n=1 Tax=Lysinibacillus macroides TaxID=33935 RepID=A0A0M9DH55_9BACI|nr:citrate lyase holo-[acyl-carrier protein] synthase [Lysinibacillus macroides]KOY81368.1 hypothetical protein ADM90_19795 [Lysinibacillus macroides]QPR68460.1 citrate lyase holo-[acyl-carrier protein] synthase [Lysinibacillus macroides]
MKLVDILKDREELSSIRKCYLNEIDSTLLQITLNIPGENKNIPEVLFLFSEALNSIRSLFLSDDIKFKILYLSESYVGPTSFIMVDCNAKDVKNMCLGLEDTHPLSKYWDLDVFNREGMKVSRDPERAKKCFICEKKAKICVFMQSHSIEELLNQLSFDIANY